MAHCPHCAAALAAGATSCPSCGAGLAQAHGATASGFSHVPHPHIEQRKKNRPKSAREMAAKQSPIGRFNDWLGVKITSAVGTMWCAYAFAALALTSLPDAIHAGTAALVAWTAQTFIQLVLLSIIIVGQKIAGEASDKRAIDTYNDAEAVLHEALQIQQHLAAQDECLRKVLAELERLRGAAP